MELSVPSGLEKLRFSEITVSFSKQVKIVVVFEAVQRKQTSSREFQ
jgi:hypothetical protein